MGREEGGGGRGVRRAEGGREVGRSRGARVGLMGWAQAGSGSVGLWRRGRTMVLMSRMVRLLRVAEASTSCTRAVHAVRCRASSSWNAWVTGWRISHLLRLARLRMLRLG